MANVCKHNVTRYPYDIARIAQDLAGGLMSTLPSDQDFEHEVTGPLLRKYLLRRIFVYKPKDLNRDWSPCFSALRDKKRLDPSENGRKIEPRRVSKLFLRFSS